METMIAFRDSAFWWIGNWALISGLDAGAAYAIWRLMSRRKEHGKRLEVKIQPMMDGKTIADAVRVYQTAETEQTNETAHA